MKVIGRLWVLLFLLQSCNANLLKESDNTCVVELKFNNLNTTELPDTISIQIQQKDGKVQDLRVVSGSKVNLSDVILPCIIEVVEPFYLKDKEAIYSKSCGKTISLDMLSMFIDQHKEQNRD